MILFKNKAKQINSSYNKKCVFSPLYKDIRMTLLFINIFGWILPSTPYRVYCADICGNFCTFAHISVNLWKGEPDAAELVADTYANHICT